jgi:hypothetical protein
MTKVTIKKVSTAEENVSKRHITFDVYEDGEYVSTFDDIEDALTFKQYLEAKAACAKE